MRDAYEARIAGLEEAVALRERTAAQLRQAAAVATSEHEQACLG